MMGGRPVTDGRPDGEGGALTPATDAGLTSTRDVGLTSAERAALQVHGPPPTAMQVARGVSGMAALWGVGWTVFNAVEMVALSFVVGLPLQLLIPGMVRFGFWGALAGGVFALFLTTMERRKSVDDLSLGRVALWGGLGTFAMVMIFILVVGYLPVVGWDMALVQGLQGGVLGAASAALTTWAAQRAPDED